jgi:hypothetical protein
MLGGARAFRYATHQIDPKLRSFLRFLNFLSLVGS